MSKILRFVIILIFTGACGNSLEGFEPDLMERVDYFKQYGEAEGLDMSACDLPFIKYVSKDELFKAAKSNAATCDETTGGILVSDEWKGVDAVLDIFTFHELAHCMLKVGHVKEVPLMWPYQGNNVGYYNGLDTGKTLKPLFDYYKEKGKLGCAK